MIRARTHDLAKGKWKGILLHLGFPAEALTGKNCPCPMCGGKDRFCFDNDKGEGSYICRGCGSGGNGWRLLEKWRGWDFKTAASEVDAVLGNVGTDPAKREKTPGQLLADCSRLWLRAQPMVIGDPVSLYLESRGCPLPENRDCLRFLASCPVPFEAGMRPAMLASVKGPDGKGVTLHRTFLRPDGSGKADMENARALMPGSLTPGSAVRLGPIEENMGIAEGLETALAARERFGIPFWAALNSANLAKWRPPQGVKRVLVCGDNDRKFGGQAAAYACAHGIAVMKEAPIVEVAIPDRSGMDWADFRSSEFVEAA